MSGLIETGLGYQSNAVSGLDRLSAQEQQQQTEQRNLDAQKKAQTIQMASSATSAGIMIAAMCIAMSGS